jgi:hypothetical protein
MSIEVPPHKELSAGDYWGLSCRLFEHLRTATAALWTPCGCDWICLYGFAYPSQKLIFFKVSNPVRRNRHRVLFFRLLKFVRFVYSCAFSILRGSHYPFISHALPQQRKSASGHCFASIRSSGRFCQVLMTRYGLTPACRWR